MLQVNEKTSIVTSSSADTQFYSSWTLAGVCKFRTIDYRLGKAVFTAHAQLNWRDATADRTWDNA